MNTKVVSMVLGLGALLCSAPYAQTVNMSSVNIQAPFPVGVTPRVAVMQGFVTAIAASPTLSFPDGCSASVAVPLCGARDSANAAKNIPWVVSTTTNRILFGAAVSDTVTCVAVCGQ